MRTASSLVLLAAAVLCRWQDPQKVETPPQGPQKPVAEKSAAEKSAAEKSASGKAKPGGAKKVLGKPERNPLEGVYRLRQRVVDGLRDPTPCKGYLAITARHMFLNIAAQGPDKSVPLLHAGVREWSKSGGDVRTVAKLDYYTDGEGGIHQNDDGKQEMRKIELVRGGVRVMQGTQSWLEFERVE